MESRRQEPRCKTYSIKRNLLVQLSVLNDLVVKIQLAYCRHIEFRVLIETNNSKLGTFKPKTKKSTLSVFQQLPSRQPNCQLQLPFHPFLQHKQH